MLISQKALAALCLYAFLLGVSLGFFYDLLRISRVLFGAHYGKRIGSIYEKELPLIGKRAKRAPKKRFLGVLIFFQDFLFCICAAVALILLFYEANEGNFRASVCLFAAVGFLLYRVTIGKTILYVSEWIAFVVEALVRYICFFAWFPVRWLGRIVASVVKRTLGRMLNAWHRRARLRYTKKQSEFFEWLADGGKATLKRKDGRHAKRKEKPKSSDADSSRRHGRRVHRGVHQ